MSSALKPALPATGGQSPGNPPTAGKPQNMPQHTGAANPYSSTPLGHVPQNIAGLPHAHSNMNAGQNIAINQVPNTTGSNQTPAHNIQTSHGTVKVSTLPPSTAASAVPAHARPNHPFIGATGTPPAAHNEEGTTLPPSQNSAQLMAMHRAQQMQQHHIDQSIDRFKQQTHQPQANQQSQQPQALSQNQQPQTNQQSPQQHQQSNGMTSNSEQLANKNTTNTTATVPTTPTKPSESVANIPASVQNHVSPPPATNTLTTVNDTNTKPVEDTPAATPATSNASQPQAQPAATTATATNAELTAPQAKQTTPTVSETETPSTETVSEPCAPVATPSPPTKTTAVVPTLASTPAISVPVSKETPKPLSTMKLATTPRNITRKRETKTVKSSESPKSATSSPSKTPDGKSPGAQNNRPPDKAKAPRTPSEEGRSKRTRIRTQPYQSPIPELALITKLSSSAVSPTKNQDEKLIVFYKNEFLAVRNLEGGFYVCQAVQNVYKSSVKIRIRWLSQGQDKIYIPDFYDTTEFDCILTNINMDRVDKGKYNLPKDELERTENILKRAIAVESGESAPSLTEEHPDGLDLSLFRDESQLKKKQKKSLKRKSGSLSSGGSPSKKSKKSKKTRDRSKSSKVSKSPAKLPVKKITPQTEKKVVSNLNSSASQSSRRSDGGRAERANRRGGYEIITPTTSAKTSPVIDQKKTRVLAKVAIKNTISASTSSAHNKKKGSKPSTSGSSKSAVVTPAASTSKSGIKSTRSQGAPSVPAATPSTSSHSTRRKKSKK